MQLLKAKALCARIEQLAKRHDFHTALAGGVLNKKGLRKDLDIVLYRRGGTAPGEDEKQAVLQDLKQRLGFMYSGDYGYVVKAKYQGMSVDIMFPHIFTGYEDEQIRNAEAAEQGNGRA